MKLWKVKEEEGEEKRERTRREGPPHLQLDRFWNLTKKSRGYTVSP